MRICCTFPGKFGDILWALPTVRAISEYYQTPVTLVISGKYGSLKRLIEDQVGYIEDVVVDHAWEVVETAPMTPRTPPLGVPGIYDRVYHLGYDSWPSQPLPYEIERIAQMAWVEAQPFGRIDLQRPWIKVSALPARDLAVGFSDEWFELKTGVADLLSYRFRDRALWTSTQTGRTIIYCNGNNRWAQEGPWLYAKEWHEAACWISSARVLLACNSALHVLGVAVGTPVVVMEPAEARWNEIFWPLGVDGPQVYQVRGNDGKPTFDARHVGDLIEQVWTRQDAAVLQQKAAVRG